MKLIILFLTMNLIQLISISCIKSNSVKNDNSPRNETELDLNEIYKFNSLTEINLKGLTSPTFIRIAKNKQLSIISFSYENEKSKKHKSLIIQHKETTPSFNVIEKAILFNDNFHSLPIYKSEVETQLNSFTNLLIAYHNKDVFRCRSSEYWPQLVKYSPNLRGFALLRLADSFKFIELKLDVLLAIDLNTKEISDFNVKSLDLESEEAYYTSSNYKDTSYLFGVIGDTTKTLDVFRIACSQAYEKIFPNLVGFTFLPNADEYVSKIADSYLKNFLTEYLRSSKKIENDYFNKYNESINLNSINDRLKTMHNFLTN